MRGRLFAVTSALGIAMVVACASNRRSFVEPVATDGGGATSSNDFFGDAGTGDTDTTSVPFAGDPATCEEAAKYHSYTGCDYWPTVLANPVWSIFDFAAVVANGQSDPVDVAVEGPNGFSTKLTVAPKSVAKVYLPWVRDLKGEDFDTCGRAPEFPSSILVPGGAYHLTTTKPVTVYQFSALEYQGAGGPAGKSWTACPGNSPCIPDSTVDAGAPIGCFSYSNDASLLLPTTALTGSYRVTGYRGISGGTFSQGAIAAIVATEDATSVIVNLAAASGVRAGPGVAATRLGGTLALTMNRGDVAELVAVEGRDLAGSLVSADKPVQVIAGMPCVQIAAPACDHLEVTVLPAETLGKQYVVTVPTAPDGTAKAHAVRLYGNRDGTTLEYRPMRPPQCPATLSAGQVGECNIVDFDFVVTGDKEFAVGSFMLGGSFLDPSGGLGDPSSSAIVAVEQYRASYVLLAPDDYVKSFIDVAAPAGTTVKLDNVIVSSSKFTPLNAGFTVARLPLAPSANGVHRIEASKPIGAQVIGYGTYTSYQLPAGLDLKHIVAPPVK